MSLHPADTAPAWTVHLDHRYADELSELIVAWQAAEVPQPRLLVLNDPLAHELGLDPEWLRTPEGVRFLVGNEVPDGARPVAQVYAGHQFGGYSSRLGDGRALLLGELTTPDGRLLDLALKGSGRTPFARGGDGLAAVGPMLREFVISEAMHALGISTTRSLAVVSTGTTLARDTGMLPGAVLTRVATSHLRVGTFQYARSTDDLDLLRRLADHAIARHHPAAAEGDNPSLALLDAVVAAQADLVARWMGVGFVHGVMNTDNMTISGESIDYGPCAFMEAYDEAAVYSSIDAGGRYAFGEQPGIAQWNLARLAESLLPLIDADHDRAVELAQESLSSFAGRYGQARAAGLRAKLGLPKGLAAGVADPLAQDLLQLMAQHRADHTSSFRALSSLARGGAATGVLAEPSVTAWTQQWLGLEPDADAMDRVNPVHIPRNQRVEEALVAATEADLGPLVPLLDAVTHPFEDLVGLELFSVPADDAFGDYTTYCGT